MSWPHVMLIPVSEHGVLSDFHQDVKFPQRQLAVSMEAPATKRKLVSPYTLHMREGRLALSTKCLMLRLRQNLPDAESTSVSRYCTGREAIAVHLAALDLASSRRYTCMISHMRVHRCWHLICTRYSLRSPRPSNSNLPKLPGCSAALLVLGVCREEREELTAQASSPTLRPLADPSA